jgi:hypothetical protein
VNRERRFSRVIRTSPRRPLPPELNVRGHTHLLGSSDITVFGAEAVALTLKGTFRALLENAPVLLPRDAVALRPRLLQWLEAQDRRPRIVGEFDDSGLMKAFGQGGAGLFVAPTAIAGGVCSQYGVRALGRIEAIADRLYAITTERRLKHPATVAIREAAQRQRTAQQELDLRHCQCPLSRGANVACGSSRWWSLRDIPVSRRCGIDGTGGRGGRRTRPLRSQFGHERSAVTCIELAQEQRSIIRLYWLVSVCRLQGFRRSLRSRLIVGSASRIEVRPCRSTTNYSRSSRRDAGPPRHPVRCEQVTTCYGAPVGASWGRRRVGVNIHAQTRSCCPNSGRSKERH